MKRLTFVLFIIVNYQLSIVNSLSAQERFIERLQKAVVGQGTVRVHHDAEIEALLNGKRITPSVPSQTVSKGKPSALTQMPDSTVEETPDSLVGFGRKVRMNGYRVQVYAGGNSRDAKRRAYQMEAQVRTLFPDQPVYTRFVSPRWICHVGDFQTRDEALDLLRELRKTGRFSEAITVKCKINAYVYE